MSSNSFSIPLQFATKVFRPVGNFQMQRRTGRKRAASSRQDSDVPQIFEIVRVPGYKSRYETREFEEKNGSDGGGRRSTLEVLEPTGDFKHLR